MTLVTRTIPWQAPFVDSDGTGHYVLPLTDDVLATITGPGGFVFCTFISANDGVSQQSSVWKAIFPSSKLGSAGGKTFFVSVLARALDTDAYNELKANKRLTVFDSSAASFVGGMGFCVQADPTEDALSIAKHVYLDFIASNTNEFIHQPHTIDANTSSINIIHLMRIDGQGTLMALKNAGSGAVITRGVGNNLYYQTTQTYDLGERNNIFETFAFEGFTIGIGITLTLAPIDSALTTPLPVPSASDKTDCQILVFDILASLYVATLQYNYAEIFNGLEDGSGAITDVVYGASFAGSYDLESVVSDICYVYGIQRKYTAAGIRFYKNTNNIDTLVPVAILDESELAVTDTASDGIRYAIATSYQDATNIVTQLALNFIDADNDYKDNQLSTKTPDAVQTDAVKTVSLPFVMRTSDAEKLVNRLLTKSRLSLITHTLRLPPKYLWVSKGDVIQVNHGAFSDVLRITDADLNADKSQSVTAETVAVATRTVPAVDYSRDVTPSGNIVKSYALILDIPALQPADSQGTDTVDNFEMYYGLLPQASGNWQGAYLARQLDGEAYKTLFHAYGQTSKLGTVIYRATAVNALSDKRWVTDPDTLTVTDDVVPWDTSKNTNKATIDADALRNLAVYGLPGRWELIQFEKIEGGIMSGIVRGLRGTENNCGLHQPGDRIFTLTPGLALTRVAKTQLGKSAVYRAVSEGLLFNATEQVRGQDFKGNSRRPFAPYHFAASRDPGTGDLTFSWVRRERLGSGWGQPAPPNSETTLAFKVVVCNTDGVAIRTLAATDTSVVYTADMQQADGVSGVTSFKLQISQLGDIGEGFIGTETVNG